MNISSEALDTMVRTLSGECRSEPLNGQLAVAYVTVNRAAWQPPTWWGQTIEEVCLKHSPRSFKRPLAIYQFSCWSDAKWNTANKDHMLRLQPSSEEYTLLQAVCLDALHGNTPDPTHGATHYKVAHTTASWNKALDDHPRVEIGRHWFYRLGSSA